MKSPLALALIMLLSFLQACAVFAPDKSLDDYASQMTLPADYLVGTDRESSEQDRQIPANRQDEKNFWWTSFQNAELNKLIDEALSGSFDVLSAKARLVQLEAEAKKSGAALWPSISGTAGAEHARTSSQTSTLLPRTISEKDPLSLGLGASYELDLWGRAYSLREADILQVLAGQDNVRTAAMTVAALTADTWINLVAARAEKKLIEEQIKVNRLVSEALALRFQSGMNTALNVLQQEEVLAASLAELPLLSARENALATQLSILLGKSPGVGAKVASDILPSLPSLPSVGLPIELLEQRPDIRSSWYSLMSAEWQVSAGKAERLPQITLSADASYAAESSLLFSNWIASLSAGLIAPIFDAGLRQAEVERLQALAEESLQGYGKTVATAVGEVRDALVNETQQEAYILRLKDQLLYASLARDKAQEGYLYGRDDFLSFILEHQNVQALERRILLQNAELLRYRVALHRALGGNIDTAIQGFQPKTNSRTIKPYKGQARDI